MSDRNLVLSVGSKERPEKGRVGDFGVEVEEGALVEDHGGARGGDHLGQAGYIVRSIDVHRHPIDRLGAQRRWHLVREVTLGGTGGGGGGS